MKFICTEDIENLAAQGKKELVVDGNTVVMELARDMARQLGIAIVDGSQRAQVQPTSSASSSSPARSVSPVTPAAPKLDVKPKGCQHGPMPVVARSEQSKTSQGTDGVVDQLVELVKQSAGKRSGS